MFTKLIQYHIPHFFEKQLSFRKYIYIDMYSLEYNFMIIFMNLFNFSKFS